MVDKEVKEKLRIIYEDLNTKIDKLQSRIVYLESKISNTNSTKNSTTIDKNTNLIPKKEIDFDILIDAISDTNTKNIVSQIYNNKYPTITSGQYKLLSDIALNNNVVI